MAAQFAAPGKVTSAPADFFQAAYEIFLSARPGANQPVVLDYALGGLVTRFEIVGDEMLSRLTRAFSHLRLEAQPAADLQVCAWDSRAGGARMVAPAWTEADFGARGEIRGFNTLVFAPPTIMARTRSA